MSSGRDSTVILAALTAAAVALPITLTHSMFELIDRATVRRSSGRRCAVTGRPVGKAKVRIRLRLRVGRELLLVVLDLGTGTRRHQQHRCPCRAGHLRTGTRPGGAANTASPVGVGSERPGQGPPLGLSACQTAHAHPQIQTLMRIVAANSLGGTP